MALKIRTGGSKHTGILNGIKVGFEVGNLNGVDLIVQAFEGGKAMLNKELVLGFVSLVPVFSALYEFIKKGKK